MCLEHDKYKGNNIYEKQANCTKNIWRSEKFLLILRSKITMR